MGKPSILPIQKTCIHTNTHTHQNLRGIPFIHVKKENEFGNSQKTAHYKQNPSFFPLPFSKHIQKTNDFKQHFKRKTKV